MADEKDIADDEQGGGGKKKLFIIIGIVAVLLIGGAVAAFLMMGGDDEAATEGEEAAAEEVAVEEGEPEYHKFDPPFVVNLPPGGPAGMLQVAIEVMTRTPSVITTLEANDPMIRHHLLNLLESQPADGLLTTGGKEALQAAISDLLAQKLEELKEPGEIKGVFFTQFVLQ
jgi:flagellar FliL protein